jgi:hypothetical protein
MMVLCPNCHDGATKGALSEEQQRHFQEKPHNKQSGYASGALLMAQSFCAIACGGTLLVGDGSSIRIDGKDLLQLTVGPDGELQLNVELQDEHGEALAVIEQNEWLSGDPSLWDMRSDHDRLKLWVRGRQISLNIDARRTPVRVSAELWHNRQLVRLSRTGVTWDGVAMSNGGIHDLGIVGMSIEVSTDEPALRLVPYAGQGLLVSEADPVERLRKSVNGWSRLSTGRGASLDR